MFTHTETKMNLSTTVKHNPVASFVVLTLGLSFATFLLPVPKDSAFATIALVLVTIPTIVSFALVTLIDGRHGLRAFLREVFTQRVALKWVVIALALGFVIHFGASLMALVTGRISIITIATLTAFFIVYFPLALLEEIGWR